MKITAVETYWTRIPFDMGGKPATMGGLNWQTMNTVWLRVVTDPASKVGEASATPPRPPPWPCWTPSSPPPHSARTHATSPACAPDCRRRSTASAATPRTLSRCRRSTSRYGTSPARPPGQPLWRLFGATPVAHLTSYASLLRYGEARWSPPHANAPRHAATATSSCTKSPCPRSAPRDRRSGQRRG